MTSLEQFKAENGLKTIQFLRPKNKPNGIQFCDLPGIGKIFLSPKTDTNKPLFVSVNDGSINPTLKGTLWVVNESNNLAIANKSIIFFDTETTGLPKNYNAPPSDTNNWPRLVQLAYIKSDYDGNIISHGDYIIKPDGFSIPPEATKTHGISNEMASLIGHDLREVLNVFLHEIEETDLLVAHNISFDENIIAAEFYRNNIISSIHNKYKICTKESSTEYCSLPGNKWPKLSELFFKLFNERFLEHNAKFDIFATFKCFWELKKRNIIKLNDENSVNVPESTSSLFDGFTTSIHQEYNIAIRTYLDKLYLKYRSGVFLIPEFTLNSQGEWIPLQTEGEILTLQYVNSFCRIGTKKIASDNQTIYVFLIVSFKNNNQALNRFIERNATYGEPIEGCKVVSHESLEPFNNKNPDQDIKWLDREKGLLYTKYCFDKNGNKCERAIYHKKMLFFSNNKGNYNANAINKLIEHDNIASYDTLNESIIYDNNLLNKMIGEHNDWLKKEQLIEYAERFNHWEDPHMWDENEDEYLVEQITFEERIRDNKWQEQLIIEHTWLDSLGK